MTPQDTSPWDADQPATMVTAQHLEAQAAQVQVQETATSETATSETDADAAELAAITAKFGTPRRTIWLVLTGAVGGYIMMLTLATALQARLTSILDGNAATDVYSRTTSLAALLMLVLIPLIGALSDRTTSRLGRRRPWIVIGYLVALVCFYLIGSLSNTLVITVAYIVGITFAQAGFNAYAVIPVEGIPNKMRGTVMGFMGLCGALAMSAGAYMAAALVLYPVLLMTAPVLLGIIFIIPLLTLYKDPQHTKEEVPEGGTLDIFRNFFVNPLEHPNFAWVWLARFLAGIAMTAFLAFFFLYLVVGLHNEPAEAAKIAGRLSLMSAPVSIFFFTTSGWISDRLGARKPFVALAAVIMAAALVVAGTSSSLTVFTVAWLLFAVGQAMYLTVDLALCAQVLPSEADAGKDMAVFGLALNLPGVIVPAVAPAVLGAHSDNYSLLWGIAAAFCLAGAFIMPLVKGVK